MGCLRLTYNEQQSPLRVVHRKSDPAQKVVQRFMSVDPLADDPRNVSWSPYTYVWNNPLRYTDPTGMIGEDEFLKIYDKQGNLQETRWLSDEGGDDYDIIHHQYGNIPEEGSSMNTEIRFNPYSNSVYGSERLEPGVFSENMHSYPGTVNPVDDPITSGDILALKGALFLSAFFMDFADDFAKGGRKIWTATRSRTAVQNAFKHWKSHGKEFPEFLNAKQYVEGARNFLNKPPRGTLSKTRANGDILRYHPSTNTFGVMDASGAPRTMFRPTDGMKYWLAQ